MKRKLKMYICLFIYKRSIKVGLESQLYLYTFQFLIIYVITLPQPIHFNSGWEDNWYHKSFVTFLQAVKEQKSWYKRLFKLCHYGISWPQIILGKIYFKINSHLKQHHNAQAKSEPFPEFHCPFNTYTHSYLFCNSLFFYMSPPFLFYQLHSITCLTKEL